MESTTNFAKRPVPSLRERKDDRKVSLVCNLLPIEFNPKENFCHQYSVKYMPEIAGDNYPLKKKILKSVSKDLREQFQPYFPSGSILFSSAKESDQTFTVKSTVEDTDYVITIDKTKNYLDLSSISTITDENIKIKSLIEVLIKNIIGANNNLVRFDDRSIYDYLHAKPLSGDMYALPGFTTSVLITQKGLLLKVYPKNKFINGKTVFDKIESIAMKNKSDPLIPKYRDYFTGKSVLAKYGSYRVYKITDIAEDKTCLNTTILTKNSKGEMETMTLEKYYKQQYNLEIKNKKQFLLIHKPKAEDHEAIYLIPELCCLTGVDEDVTDSQREELKNCGTRLTPSQKMSKIKEINNWLTNTRKKTKTIKKTTIESSSPNDIKKEWGLEFKDFFKFEGRELSMPSIYFKYDNKARIENGKFRYEKCLNNNNGFTHDKWICLVTKDNSEAACEMIKSLQKASLSPNIPLDMPNFIHFSGRRVNDWIENLRDTDLSAGKKLILVVLDRNTRSYYSALKNYLVTEVGVPSQFVLTCNKTKTLSYFGNVLYQMTSKTNGELYQIGLDDDFNKRHITMIVGLDSSRFGKHGRKYTLSASYNQNLSKFYTQQLQSSLKVEGNDIDKEKERQRMITELLSTLVTNALQYFNKLNKKFPEYIIIYRSGGNDSQRMKVFQEEYPALNDVFTNDVYFNKKMAKNPMTGKFEESLTEKTSIKFTYITVNKKTDIKFFQNRGNNDLVNPGNGTVIDSDVVHPEHYDFYLQPQFCSGQCTATPVHYQCMYDGIHISLETLERITFWQTFLYWNWAGPIREPAALKFAEVCNTFTSKHLSDTEPKEKLWHTPYYI